MPRNSSLLIVCFLTALMNIPFVSSTSLTGSPLSDNFFSDVTSSAGVSGPDYGGRGVCWGDYNNDGLVDFYVGNSGGRNYLYTNNGDGTFSDDTFSAGVECDTYSNGVSWGDYDNDDDLDLYVVNFDFNTLYENEGDGTFTDVTMAAGVEDYSPGEGATWVDYNGDGFLDIYVVNGGPYYWSNVLFRNETDGTFDDQSSISGLDDYNPGEMAAWADYDNDGDQDVYVTNRASNKLFRNNGDGTFDNVTSEAGVGDYGKGHGVTWGDFDSDGWLDLYVVNRLSANVLYHNNGDGTFTNIASEAGVDDNELYTVGTAAFDFDNDGDLDIFNVSGGENRLFSNDGDGTFTEVTDSAGVADYGRLGNGTAFADFNNDGYLDLYVVNWENGCVLFENMLSGNNWISIKLKGNQSNHSAIGARVELTADGAVQIREVNGGSGFLSQNCMDVHFGVGSVETIDQIVVRFPSGSETILEDVAVNQVLEIDEELIPVTIDLTPSAYSFDPGDTMRIHVVLRNHTSQIQYIDGWSEVVLPGGYIVKPLLGPYDFPLFPSATMNFFVSHVIPILAPDGDYSYSGKVGSFPDEFIDKDEFVFSVQATH